MSWHHVVPFSVLCGVWNRLVDQHIATQLAEARVAIRQYLLLCDWNQPNLDVLIDRMRAANTSQKRAGHQILRPLEVSEARQMATAAVWPPWNAVEGPRDRSDDPRDRYIDRFTCGLTAQECARMRVIEWLYDSFGSFVGAGPAPGPSSLRALTQAVSSARPMLAHALPIGFRDEMWVNDGGHWRKRREPLDLPVA